MGDFFYKLVGIFLCWNSIPPLPSVLKHYNLKLIGWSSLQGFISKDITVKTVKQGLGITVNHGIISFRLLNSASKFRGSESKITQMNQNFNIFIRNYYIWDKMYK